MSTTSMKGATKVEVHKVECLWTIENFSYFDKYETKQIVSPTYSTIFADKIDWFFVLTREYVFCGMNVNKLLWGLYIKFPSSNRVIKVKCNMIRHSYNNEEISFRPHSNKITLRGLNDMQKMKILSFNHFEVFPGSSTSEDEIIIKIQVGFTTNEEFITPVMPLMPEISKRSIGQDFESLYNTQKSADVTFIINKEKLPAHSQILSARSPVFSAMFEHPMIERAENRITVTDVDSAVFKELLHFIYTDKAPNAEEMAIDLLVAADKYQVDGLRVVCEEILRKSITVENAAEIFVYADLHHANDLKKYIAGFIAENKVEVIDTSGYKILVKDNPQLAVTLLREILALP